MVNKVFSGPLPAFDSDGNLPPGIYLSSLHDIKIRFATTPKRIVLFEGLFKAIENLKNAGVVYVFIDGSFTTNKTEPNDIDGCWVPNKWIDTAVLDPVFTDRNPPRQKMRDKYGVDFLIAGVDVGDNNQPIANFFQKSREDQPKGVILLDITK